ncbi:MAG: hypothetical protein WCE44_02565 [Candidatus Velthaea sp.]
MTATLDGAYTYAPSCEVLVAARRLAQRYNDRFGLGPLPADFGLDDRFWSGLEHDGKIVAVYAERFTHDGVAIVEVTDAYCEPTKSGFRALRMIVASYQSLLDRGLVRAVRYNVRIENQRFARMVYQASGVLPVGLIFEHRRREA